MVDVAGGAGGRMKGLRTPEKTEEVEARGRKLKKGQEASLCSNQ